MPRKTGLSSVPSPRDSSPGPGAAPIRATASMRAGSCTVAIWSAVAGVATTVDIGLSGAPITPSSLASSTVRSTRTGDMG